jgi:predicted transcriptional regulator
MANRSHILEVRGDQGADVFRALANESRLSILQLLAAGDRNINELGQALGLSQPTITKHVQQLELAGLLVSEYKPGVQGMQKRCRLRHDRLLVTFDAPPQTEHRVEETSMPIGLYTLAHPVGRCGLANRTKIIGFLDKPQSYFDPERATTQILWMEDGFVEYTFPNDLPTSMEVTRFELLMEICSEVGTWTSPGDFGGKRGVLNPDWWIDHMTQYGLLKVWSVDSTGSFVDGNPISDVKLERLLVMPQSPLTVRIGVKPDAEHRGGFNLFGSGFGNYAQDLLLRLTYASKNPVARRPAVMAEEGV